MFCGLNSDNGNNDISNTLDNDALRRNNCQKVNKGNCLWLEILNHYLIRVIDTILSYIWKTDASLSIQRFFRLSSKLFSQCSYYQSFDELAELLVMDTEMSIIGQLSQPDNSFNRTTISIGQQPQSGNSLNRTIASFLEVSLSSDFSFLVSTAVVYSKSRIVESSSIHYFLESPVVFSLISDQTQYTF